MPLRTRLAFSDVSLLESGRDAWVMGNEPVVLIDFQGMADCAKKNVKVDSYSRISVIRGFRKLFSVHCKTAAPHSLALDKNPGNGEIVVLGNCNSSR
jgi:hypothetical protein